MPIHRTYIWFWPALLMSLGRRTVFFAFLAHNRKINKCVLQKTVLKQTNEEDKQVHSSRRLSDEKCFGTLLSDGRCGSAIAVLLLSNFYALCVHTTLHICCRFAYSV